jgi:uncharacterized protein (DUF362 family)
MKRREFIKQTARAAAGAAIIGGGIFYLGKRNSGEVKASTVYQPKNWRVNRSPDKPILAAVKNPDWSMATVTAIGALGGIESFVAKGDYVCLKPNIGWDRTPQMGADTNPDVVAELVRLCLAAEAAKVVVVDVSCNSPNRTFNRSGIKEAAQKAGAEVIIPNDGSFTDVDFGPDSLGQWQVLKPILECDRLINVPIVKHHSLSGMTASMKNWFGALTGPRNKLHQNINDNLVELCRLFQPTLTVLDATRVLQRNGPTGGNLADVITYNTVIASTDQVAADAYATRYLKLKPSDFSYIKMAEEAGLGVINPSKEKIAEIEV